MRIVRPVVQTVGQVAPRVRDIARLQKVARILMTHGLGMLVAGIEIPGVERPEDKGWAGTPTRVADALKALGPTYVKLGQVLSTRSDILPDSYIEALASLQDDVGPIPIGEMRQLLASELGVNWEDDVGRFDREPLATASIAQVHRGALKDGTEVVFKVQRPGAEAMIRADLNILHFLARRILAEWPEARSLDPISVVEEFERSITAELEFLTEAKSMERFRTNFEHVEIIHIPVVYPEFTTQRVLCMEFLDGVKLRDAREAGCDMALVGDRLLSVAYDMLLIHGFFHGDMHPGNVIILPGNIIGLLDFGMVGRITDEMRSNVIYIVHALQRGDYRTIARLFYDIAIKDERVDYGLVERDTIEVMEKHWAGAAVKDVAIGPYVMDLAQRAAGHGARVPTAYTMFFKALITAEGMAKTLITEVDPIAAAEPYFQRLMAERYSPQRIQQDLMYEALTFGSLLKRLPISMAQFLDDVDKQRLSIGIRLDHSQPLDRYDRMLNRGIAAAFTLTFTVCGTIAMVTVLWIPLAILLYLMAALSGMVTLWMMVRNRG